MAMRRKPLIQDERELTHATASATLSALQEEEGVSVIIPVFNEEKGIKATLGNLHAHLATSDFNYEVIIVNDGSTDNTRGILRSCQDILVVEHGRNRGYGAALKTGIRHARFPLIAITDADGTYPNEKIPDLVAHAARADMVVGARIGAINETSLTRRIAKWFLTRFAEWIVGCPIPDLNSGLRVFHKRLVERFLNILPDTFSFTTTITIAMLTNRYRVLYEPIDYHSRVGTSKIHPVSDTLRFLQLILRTGIYFAPLRIFLPLAGAFFLGFLFTLSQDIFIRQDLTERTLILFVTSAQLAVFALLADMIDKRMR